MDHTLVKANFTLKGGTVFKPQARCIEIFFKIFCIWIINVAKLNLRIRNNQYNTLLERWGMYMSLSVSFKLCPFILVICTQKEGA